jgi:HAD superfamily hydrolase (TIGR01509 family)
MKSFEAVLFDLDGVLVDSYDCWFRLLNDILQEDGKHPLTQAEFHKTWGQGPEADRQEFLSHWSLKDLIAVYDRRFPDYTKWARPIEGSKECLLKLQSLNQKIGVASNSPTAVVRALLKSADLLDLVPVAIGSDQVVNEKPAPDLLLKALEVLETSPENACYIGDSIFDEKAARAAGIFFVGFQREGDVSVENFEQLISFSTSH